LAFSLGVDGLDGPDHRNIADGGGRGDLGAIHEPHRRIAVGVAPNEVTLTVAAVAALAGSGVITLRPSLRSKCCNVSPKRIKLQPNAMRVFKYVNLILTV
jgi:hypothetical protein